MNGKRHVVVRMYNVGFGDCLLVTITGGSSPWRMLVDCGVHAHGVGSNPLSAVVDDVIATARGNGGPPRLDVVVATHRHRDHIIGFDDDRWADVEVGEVWLPWTEDPGDTEARAMRLELDEVARALTMQLAATDEELAGLALNSLTNDAAMSTLLHGFAGDVERRFLRATDEPLEIKGVRSARIHVLGPPEDKDTLRRMNPPASERWLADTGPDGPSTAPFPPELSMTPDEFRRRYSDLALPAETVKRLRTGIAEPLEAVSWLDRCVNNTSVFMALEVDDIVVLLAGDAQWGPWRRAMADQRICDLIRRVNVYKVSHHGSHNGTPRSLVEGLLRDDVLSLVSVHPVKAWKNIPKDTLVQALSVANRELARSDDSVVPASLHRQTDGLWIEATLPRA